MHKQAKKLISKFDAAPYYFQTNGAAYFYVVKGKWEQKSINVFKQKGFKMGIADSEGQLLSKVKYTKIFSPDVTAKDWIETEVNGKYGLFNYKTKAAIPCQYDIIYPAATTSELAIGQIDNHFFSISKDGTTKKKQLVEPIFQAFMNKWKYTAQDNKTPILIRYAKRDKDQGIFEGNGVSFLPSCLLNFNTFPEMFAYIIPKTENKNQFDEGTEELHISVEDQQKTNDGVWGVVSNFYESGIGVRDGYSNEDKSLTTVDQNNKKISSIKFASSSSGYGPCGSMKNEYQFINKNLLFTKNVHFMGTVIKLFRIEETGKITSLTSPRKYAYTKYVSINEQYFKGCFCEEIPNGDYEEGNIYLSKHLSVEELDIMRNEIFAEYGYRFKNEKWQKYFGQFDWYTPQYDNVDEQLSEIDKANIKVILKAKKKIEQDASIIGKHKIVFVAAG